MSSPYTYDAINERIREHKQEIIRLKREILIDEAELLKRQFNEIFRQFPDLQLISWHQEAIMDDNQYDTFVVLMTMCLDGATINFHNNSVNVFDGSGNTPPRVCGVAHALEQIFDATLRIDKYDLKGLFGYNTFVVATRHGVTPIGDDVDILSLHPDFNIRYSA